MDNIFTLLQSTGLVWKKNSWTNTILVAFWNVLSTGSSVVAVYIYMVVDGVAPSTGFILLVDGYFIVLPLATLLGSLTLGKT